MLIVEIEDAGIFLKDITQDDLYIVLNLYNRAPDFKFGTGIDKPITFKTLYQKFVEVQVCKDEFFAGIYIKPDIKLIGVIRGGITSKSNNTLRINSIIIDKQYQNMGYGTKIIESIINLFKSYNKIDKALVQVVDKNVRAKKFWGKLGFKELRKMYNHIVLDNQEHDVVIMQKELNI